MGLLKLVFDGWPRFDLKSTSLEHWKWEYLDNQLKLNAIVVTVSDNKIIRCNHGYYLRTKIGESSFLCGYGEDVAVHPDHRRKGVYQKMSIKKKELREKDDRKLSIRTSRNPIMTRRWNKSDRPPSPQTIVNLVRIQDIYKHLEAMPVKNLFLMKTGFILA